MKTTSAILAYTLAAASLASFGGLSYAQDRDDYRRGPGRDAPRVVEQNRGGPPAGYQRDAGPRRFDHRPPVVVNNNTYYPQRGDMRHDRRDLRDGRYAYYGARGPQFHRGGYIPREYRNRQYVVGNWQAHRLHAPQRGYQWVQVGPDYALIAIATGLIAQLVLSN